MIEFVGQNFGPLHDRGDALLLEDLRFERCSFNLSTLSLTTELGRRTTVRNVELKNCAAHGCTIGPAIFENVKIHGLTTTDLLIVWDATFKHVTLSGTIGQLKINPFVDPVDRTEHTQGPFDRNRTALYDSIDWALDISAARFRGFDVRGIPARLFRRDPETQVVVTRERALRPGWRERLSPTNTLWPFMIQLFLSDGDADMVLVAPLGAPRKRRQLLIDGLDELRALGVCEPD